MHHILAGIVSLTLLAACGQGEPQTQAEPAEEEILDLEIPDIVIPENE